MGLHTGHPFVAPFPVTLAILVELATLSVPSLTDSLPTRSGVVSAPTREAGTQATAGSSPPDPLATVWLQASLEALNVRVAHKNTVLLVLDVVRVHEHGKLLRREIAKSQPVCALGL